MSAVLTTEMHYPPTREDWLALRHQDISSTESAGLFYNSPYTTAVELAVVKRDEKYSELELGERAEWGLRLQRAIAKGIADDFKIQVRALTGYGRLPGLRMGASFDYEIIGLKDEKADNVLANMFRERGRGVLEIKNVDGLVFHNSWGVDELGMIQAPAHIEIQLQHQLDVLGYDWGCIGVLIGGNRALAIVRPYYPDVGAGIRKKVAWFWDLFDKKQLPPVVYPNDADAIIKLYQHVTADKVKDARNDDTIIELCTEYVNAQEDFAAADLAKKTIKAKLLQKVEDAEKILVPGFSFSCVSIGPTRVEAFEKSGYRNFYLRKVKAKK